MKKSLMFVLAILALVIVACGGQEPEPAAPVVEEAAEEVMEEVAAEEAMEEEEVAEEAMEEEVAEEAMEEEVAEEAMEEDAMEEEAMEEEHSDEMMEEEAAEEMAEEGSSDEMMEDMSEITYAINASESTVSWYGAKATGSSHTGTIDISEGSLVVAGDALVSGSFIIDMNTISEPNARLVGHLKDDDFFGVATYPTASLVIVSAEPVGDNQYQVVGDLTIKEITHPIEFVATAIQEDGLLTAEADMVFDRAMYDVQYGSGTFFADLGNDLINDEVEISVVLVAGQ